MSLFAIRIAVHGETHSIDYDSIDAAISDQPLMCLLDNHDAEATIWAGTLRITGRPLRASDELCKALAENARTIMRRIL